MGVSVSGSFRIGNWILFVSVCLFVLFSCKCRPAEANNLHDSAESPTPVEIYSHGVVSRHSRASGSGGHGHSNGDPSFQHYVTGTRDHTNGGEHKPPRRYQVAKFEFDRVSTPYIISMWIIIVGLAKIGFHVTPKLSSICPESVVLMVLGVVIGLVMYFAGIPDDRLQPLTPNLFFLFMLPPIVMDAGYHMPNRLFFDNLTTILLYAVVGTIWNALAIGLSLYGCSKWGAFGEEIPFLDIMLFASTVSAVDPVAVLAVFEEIHVNEVLYILVFGESLLNDAVTVVLYHMFEGYAEMAYHYGLDSIQMIDYAAGAASFFVVALGGTAMGIFWGFLAAFVSRFTHHVKIIEPIFVFVMAYLSYLSAEMFHLSGILALTFCGITMKNYVEENITQKSHTTLKYAMKMLANSSEAIIFVFLGVCTVNDQHHWNTAFVFMTIVFCLVYRTIGVIALTAITNRFRLHKVDAVEQFIMSYGGLRGAVAFALILIINRQIIRQREMFVTTIIAVVYFTVFLQGMTVGALVKILNVERAKKYDPTMNERIHTRLMDHLMAGLEDISGMMMGNYKMRDKFRYYNNHYLRKWLLRNSKESGNNGRKILATASKLDLKDAMNLVSKQQLYANPENNSSSRYLYNGDNNNNFDDDKKNGGGGGGGSGSGGNGGGGLAVHGPSIFLTVPQVSDRYPLVNDEEALAKLFRSFTQSNLVALNEDDGNTELSNVDDNKLNRSSSFDHSEVTISDDETSELGHILDEAMFKPLKHTPHYTRSDYSEEPQQHPPFQHQVRMHIRKMFSQSQKTRRRSTNSNDVRRTKSDKKVRRSSPNGGRHRNSSDAEKHEARKRNGDLVQKKASAYSNNENSVDDDDDGITFTADKQSSVNGQVRQYGHESGLRSQREFPSWIDNRDAVPDYTTPTNTLIQRIDQLEPKNSLSGSSSSSSPGKPNIREIFGDKAPTAQPPTTATTTATKQPQYGGMETKFSIEKPPGVKSKIDSKAPSSSKKDDQVVIRFHNTSSDSGKRRSKNGENGDDDDDGGNDRDEHVTISRL